VGTSAIEKEKHMIPRRMCSIRCVALVLTSIALSITASSLRASAFTFTTIDVPGPGATFTEAQGINARGDIVAPFGDASGGHGLLLSRGVFTTIDVPNATITEPFGINARGDIVGAFGNASGGHGFLLSRGVFTTIDVPGATNGTNAFGINAAGDI